MIYRIPLGCNKFALVDAVDYDYLMQWTWKLGSIRNENGKIIRMHHVVLERKLGHNDFKIVGIKIGRKW